MRGAAQPRGAEATIGDCGSVRRIRSHKEKMSESTPTARPLRVFIADDSPAVSEMLVALIYDRGRIEVVGTGDSEAGSIESIQRLRPDVVVLDLQLKGGSGTNGIRAVRAGMGGDEEAAAEIEHREDEALALDLDRAALGHFRGVAQVKKG